MSSRSSSEDMLPDSLYRTSVTRYASISDPDEIERIHKEALLAAQREHERVRESALRAFRNYKIQEDQLRLLEIERQEEQRLKLEKERAELAAKVIELQQKQIEIPKIPPPIAYEIPPTPSVKALSSAQSQSAPITSQEVPPQQAPLPLSRPPPPTSVQQPPASQSSIFSAAQNKNVAIPISQQATTISKPVTIAASTAQVVTPIPRSFDDTSNHLPGTERYLEIHKTLKKLRQFMADTAKQNQDLKKVMGEGRREIRKSVGQLTEGRGANKAPLAKILAVLREALNNIPSPPIDPAMIILSSPQNIETSQASNNGDSLPSLFIYLLNIFAKSCIRQLTDEAGVKPAAADPIGVTAVSVFGQNDLQWRGLPLIDILIAKLRVVCPVLFGVRGDEKTDEGRGKVGWWKENGHWVPEQVHHIRMTGLGAGFAAISLRDFSKSKMKNPYPPTHYWQSMAAILSTPPEQATSTQYQVLKSMINNYEKRFLDHYGHAARAALQVALVDWPSRAIERSVAVNSLMVLSDKLKREEGLSLNPPPR